MLLVFHSSVVLLALPCPPFPGARSDFALNIERLQYRWAGAVQAASCGAVLAALAEGACLPCSGGRWAPQLANNMWLSAAIVYPRTRAAAVHASHPSTPCPAPPLPFLSPPPSCPNLEEVCLNGLCGASGWTWNAAPSQLPQPQPQPSPEGGQGSQGGQAVTPQPLPGFPRLTVCQVHCLLLAGLWCGVYYVYPLSCCD